MPLDPKLQKFTTASPAIASYDFTDILEGTGTIIFQGYRTDAGAYILSQSQPFSKDIETTHTGGGTGAYVLVGDNDFDLSPFKISQTIKGVAIVNISQKSVTSGASRFTIKVRKWDGSSETEIVSVTANAEGTSDIVTHCVNLTVPSTPFAAGDVLRLTIETWINSGTSQTMYYSHDPQNRDGANIIPSATPVTTKLEFHCPFELNI